MTKASKLNESPVMSSFWSDCGVINFVHARLPQYEKFFLWRVWNSKRAISLPGCAIAYPGYINMLHVVLLQVGLLNRISGA